MATKKKPRAAQSAKKASAARHASAKQQTTNPNGRRQATAVVLFAVALLMLCFAVFQLGEAGTWVFVQLHGLFGWTAVAVPVLLGYVAVLLALGDKRIAGRTVTASLLLFMAEGATFIFSHLGNFDKTVSYGAYLAEAYTAAGWGSGWFGAVLGWPLTSAFSSAGAAIIIVLLLAVALMLITGTGIITLFNAVTRPVKKAKQHIEEQMDTPEVPAEAPAAPAAAAPAPAPRRRRKKIDIELGQYPDDEPTEPTPPEPPLEPEMPRGAAAPVEAAAVSPEVIAEEVAAEEEAAIGTAASYRFPPMSLLDEPRAKGTVDAAAQDTAARLVNTLKEFGVSTTLSGITRGPSVTRYELEPSAGVKISRITGLADDIALRLAAGRVRIEAPIPNKAAVGIEIPNRTRDTVCLREVLDTDEFSAAKSRLSVALGKDIEGRIVLADLAAMPHLLIAGTTGSGKSVCTNSMIQSVLYRATPDEVKLILIDPKQVEFNVYNGIPHLLIPVVTDPRKAAGALGWAVNEMTRRYNLCAEHNVRDIKAYNALAARREDIKPVPQILIVIDELADLMMAAASEVEDSICRLAQMARAAGMHMVIATQRPSVDVITGLIKANIPSRLALTVASAVDSRTILDSSGAEKLLGYGDMLFMPVGMNKPQRIQGCYVSDREVESVVAFLKRSEEQEYDNAVIEEINSLSAQAGLKGKKAAAADEGEGGGFEEEDSMLMQAIEVVVEAGEASTSMLQRRLRVGYARAGRLMDIMEQRGIIGPHEGSKPRAVLITRQQFQEMQLMHSEE